MKIKILCWAGIIWGGAIVIRGFITGPTVSGSASDAGGFVGFIVGFIILGVSIYNRKKVRIKEE